MKKCKLMQKRGKGRNSALCSQVSSRDLWKKALKMHYRNALWIRAFSFLLVISHYFQTVNTAEGFKVIGPDGPVVAVLGGDAELPCRLSPPLSAEHMQVRWFRSRYHVLVHLYENGTDQNDDQIPEYRGRTELIRTHISNGSVSLRIHSVRLKDEGTYTCIFWSDPYYEEEATLELKVAGLGTAPSISIEDYVCIFPEDYPEPEVTWREEDGQSLTSLSDTDIRGQKDAFFQRGPYWVVSLSIVMSVVIPCSLLVALVVFKLWKQRKERGKVAP
ncbi:myelin-oligodendrocyte glycoprotein-like [Rhinatrema bivittatum]|uniref:myelin-oligodendrocyte glycoprotein-like n=1 Tax=Rhinatrema bivittatum TaxID=194408 RepID=UPI00112A4E8E|nr:myelin-oligodendrocyte glycoprotein-like [Rhinatrema bivittatum]